MPTRGLRRAIFVLLLGVYLTLICPGHDHGGEHSAPHFAFLGEPDAEHEAPVPQAGPPLRLAGLPFGPGLIGLTAANVAETLGLTVADVALTSESPTGPPHPQPGAHREAQAGHAQVALRPAHPPPRHTG